MFEARLGQRSHAALGRTDTTGTETANQTLSRLRVDVVRARLVSLGLPADGLDATVKESTLRTLQRHPGISSVYSIGGGAHGVALTVDASALVAALEASVADVTEPAG